MDVIELRSFTAALGEHGFRAGHVVVRWSCRCSRSRSAGCTSSRGHRSINNRYSTAPRPLWPDLDLSGCPSAQKLSARNARFLLNDSVSVKHGASRHPGGIEVREPDEEDAGGAMQRDFHNGGRDENEAGTMEADAAAEIQTRAGDRERIAAGGQRSRGRGVFRGARLAGLCRAGARPCECGAGVAPGAVFKPKGAGDAAMQQSYEI